MEEEVKGYSDSREEEEEEEAAEVIAIRAREEEEEISNRLQLQQQDAAAPNLRNEQVELMELSLGGSSSSSQQGQSNERAVEKEHMFDKVVTPSDVGKLNRLVIPKQHAEKYFPLDSSSNEKGLLLNFEDRNGKLWRFRYSYWNSSQSYVMTKGWSRFVKEKKLDAGDIVSFQRGLGDIYRHRLYIDWRRRPDHPSHPHHHYHPSAATSLVTPLFLPNHNHYSFRWGGRFYSLPSPSSQPPLPSNIPNNVPPPTRHLHDHQFLHHHQQLNYNRMYAFHQQQQQQQQQQQYHGVGDMMMMNSGSGGSGYYLRSTPSMSMVDQQQERAPMIIDSVPVAHHHHSGSSGGVVVDGSNSSSAGKRLRLFGVNMECASSSSVEEPDSSLPSSSSSSPLQRRFGDQRGETAVLFDLDPSLNLQYPHH